LFGTVLTKTQIEFLDLLVSCAWRDREVAAHLGIAVGAVKMRLSRICTEINMHSRLQLAVAYHNEMFRIGLGA
jgi:DNA-binding NarL/FixJ family response regulator